MAAVCKQGGLVSSRQGEGASGPRGRSSLSSARYLTAKILMFSSCCKGGRGEPGSGSKRGSSGSLQSHCCGSGTAGGSRMLLFICGI